jgi:predicted transcriptional regulator
LKDLEHQIERFAILEDNNIMDSIRLFYTFSSNVIPVINKNEKYLGILPVKIFFRTCPVTPYFQKQALSLR